MVVFSEQEAKEYKWKDASGKEQFGIEIDHDDSHAMKDDGKPFALLLHGSQPAGTEAGKALHALGGRSGVSSYKKGKKTKLTDPFEHYIPKIDGTIRGK